MELTIRSGSVPPRRSTSRPWPGVAELQWMETPREFRRRETITIVAASVMT